MLFPILLSASAGILGTGIGGLAGAYLGATSGKLIARVLSFAGGVMLGVVCFDLIPEALSLADFRSVLLGLLAGIFITAFINHAVVDLFLPPEGQKGDRLFQTGILLFITISLHNLPEGIAIGSGSAHDLTFGLTIALMIALHDFPEGMAISSPLAASGMTKGRAAALAALSGATTAFGGLVGGLLGGISPEVTAFCISAAGGAMLYVTFSEVLPQSYRLRNGSPSSFFTLAGCLAGFIFTIL